LSKDNENPRKKNHTEIWEIKSSFSQKTNAVQGHCTRLEQVEDKLSELKGKIEIKEKNRRNLS
jgi:hypothetical protein